MKRKRYPMTFYTEPTGYQKSALSDLQGAWQNFRDAVVEAQPFSEWDRLLFHIDEGMSWDSVWNLENMRNTLLLIENIASQSKMPDEVAEWISVVKEHLDEVFVAIAKDEI